jgi:hypothetical protein
MRESNSQSHSQCQEVKCVVFVISADLQVLASKLKEISHAKVLY